MDPTPALQAYPITGIVMENRQTQRAQYAFDAHQTLRRLFAHREQTAGRIRECQNHSPSGGYAA